MLRNYILRVALMFMLLAGTSYALNAQCNTGCSNQTQYNLNEVVICHTGACGEHGTFSFTARAGSSFAKQPQKIGFAWLSL